MYLSLLLLMVLPTVYNLIATMYAGVYHLSLDLLGQIEWFDLIAETMRMFLIMPLYYLINRYCKKDGNLQKECKGILSGLGIISCGIYIVFSVIVFGAIPEIVSVMKISDIDRTIIYLKLETITFLVTVIYDFCLVVFVNLGKARYIYLLLLVRLFLYIGANVILIPIWGEKGIAVADVMSVAIISIVSVGILCRKGYLGRPSFKKNIIFKWMKEGIFQGSSVLVDNVAYGWMICRIVNDLQGMGEYWVANNFIWGFLLLPCVAMVELLKKECNDDGFEMKKYCRIIIGILIMWIVTFPGWKWFMGNVMLVKNVGAVLNILVCLVPYYIFYMYSQVLDNYFSATGNSRYLTINSLIVNGIYYVIMFVLYSMKIVIPDMNFVVRMFGFGMVIHFVVSVVEYRRCNELNIHSSY